MKNLFYLGMLIPTLVFGGLNSTCHTYTDSKVNTFKITKNINPKNILYFSVTLDDETCSFNKENSKAEVSVYWIMGENTSSNEMISCEPITSKEIKKILGFKNKNAMDSEMVRVIDEGTIELNIPNLPKLGKKMGKNTTLSSILTLKANENDGACEVIASAVRDSKDIEFDQLDLKIKMFSLKQVRVLNDGLTL